MMLEIGPLHVGYVEAYHPNMLDDGRCLWSILICRFLIEAGGVNEGQHQNLHLVVWVLSAFFSKSKCRSDATLFDDNICHLPWNHPPTWVHVHLFKNDLHNHYNSSHSYIKISIRLKF